jgi:hypothetical protein
MLIQQGARVPGGALARIVTREGLIDGAVVDQWRSGGGTVRRLIGKKYGGDAPLVCPESGPFLLNLTVAAPSITLGVGSRARETRLHSVIPSQIREQLDQGDSYSSRLL